MDRLFLQAAPDTKPARRQRTRYGSYRTMFEQWSEILFVVRTEAKGSFCFETINRAAERAFGLADAAIGGLAFEQLIDRAPGDGWRSVLFKTLEYCHSCVQTAEPLVFEGGMELLTAHRDFRVELTPLLDASGRVHRIVGVARDITKLKRAQAQLRTRTEQFNVLAENSPDTIARYDGDCRRVYSNAAFSRRIGMPAKALLGKRPSEWSFAPWLLVYENKMRAVLHSGEACEEQYSWPAPDGRLITTQFLLAPEFDEHGRVTGVLSIGRDITMLKESERRLAEAEAMAHVGHWQWNYARQRSLVSSEVCRIFGMPDGWAPTLGEIVARIYKEDRDEIIAIVRQAQDEQAPEADCKHRIRSGGQLRHLHTRLRFKYGRDGTPLQLVGTIQDITELKDYEHRLHYLTFIDTLTGLPNRALFTDRTHQAVADASRRNQVLGLAILDLDRFKEINDSYGHGLGDRLLCEAVQRLKGLVRSYDTIARLGGNEFALIMPEIREAADLGSICHNIREAIAAPFYIAGYELFITASIGIAVFPTDALDADTLLQYAGSALNDAKMRGRATHQFYSSELTARVRDRHTLEQALRQAIRNEEFEVRYQPKVDLRTGRMAGVEALLRWQHPQLGLVPPDKFIGIAEDSGLIVDIGEWVLHTACRQARLWNEAGGHRLPVAINLSTRQFQTGSLLDTVRSVLKQSACRPEWIELEITESLLMDDDRQVRQTLEAFAAMGLSIAIDDFGTGYSMLSYLNRFPIHTLKIDRSFICGLPGDNRNAELVKAILSMGRALHLAVVAEGVETAEQESFLRAEGCDLAQGYYYGRPVPPERLDMLSCD